MLESHVETRAFGQPTIAFVICMVAAAVTLLFAVLVAYVTMYDAPYWDLWQHVNRDTLLKDLFSRNNEHPVVTNRLMFWIDDALFSASSRFVQFVAFLSLASQIVLFAWLARIAGAKRALLIVAPVSTVFILYPFGFENTIWIFQVSMVCAFTSALGAFTLFAAYAQRRSLAALCCSLAFSTIAVLSFANGVLVPTIVAAMALWLKPKSSIPFVIITLLAWAWQLSAAPGAPSVITFETIGAVLEHFLIQLGSPVGWAAGYVHHLRISISNQDVAFLAGLLVMALSFAALAFICLRARRSPAMVAVAAVIVFSLATAALIAISRHAMGTEQALSSRYNINAALLYSALLIVALVAAQQFEGRARRWLAWGGTALTVPLLALALTSAVIFINLTGRYRGALEGTVSLVAGVRDEDRIGQLAFDIDLAERETAEFRKNRKWMFAAPITLRLGEKLSATDIAAPACAGASWTISDSGGAAGFRKVTGLLPRQSLSVGAKHVLITDASDAFIGYGHVPRRASDLNLFVQQDGAIIDWIGRIRPNTAPPYRAWLADDNTIRCALRQD